MSISLREVFIFHRQSLFSKMKCENVMAKLFLKFSVKAKVVSILKLLDASELMGRQDNYKNVIGFDW